MKKLNKKGFTIVELSIVIAVVAILSAVMIPTFSGITNKAKDSAALQEAKNAYTEYLGAEFDYTTNEDYTANDFYFKASNGRYVIITDGEVEKTVYASAEKLLEKEKGANAAKFKVVEGANGFCTIEAVEKGEGA